MKFSTEEIQQEFKSKLRRCDVLRLGGRLGLTGYTVRRLLREGHIPPIRYIGCVRAYYDRDTAVSVMLPAHSQITKIP